MSKLSVDKLLNLVERSKLVEADQLAQVVADWKSRATADERDDSQCLSQCLADAGLLTMWQCHKLLEGRYRGFYLGKYKLLDHLGSGGMSSVYLAEHVLMQRRVAIKVLPQNRVSDSSYLARFHFEAQVAAALDHRNIVRVYDLDNEGRIHYLVMEYIEGRDLYDLVGHEGPLDYHTAAHYVAQAATGLDHAHHAGLVHRDIKPANLLVDLKGTVKILDMGLAKFTGKNVATPGFSQDEHVLGTADYLAPEQAVNSQTVDHRADIYALGCTLYFLLTGHPPFASGTPLERMTAHQQQIPPNILLDRPDAPAELLAICRRMMEKSLENRYQSAAEVCDALHAWLESEAAIGRHSPRTLVSAKRTASPPSAPREKDQSKLNIVSGSASDLHLPPEPPRIASPFEDTDPNLHRATVKIPARRAEPVADSSDALSSKSNVLHPGPLQTGGSAVLSSDGTPTPPPLLAPPLSAPPLASWVAPAPRLPIPSIDSQGIMTNVELPRALSTPLRIPRRSRSARNSHWLSVLVLSGLILAVVLLAIFALPK